MKNKKMIYVLVPLVGLIWGIIIYRIFTHIRKSEQINNSSLVLSMANNAEVSADTITLLLNYRDPFQSYTFRRTEKQAVFSSRPSFTQKTIPKPEIVWPDILFNGLIVNSRNKSKTGIILFNRTSYLVKEGEMIKGYKILKLYNDSVSVGFEKNKKTFKR